MQIETTGIAPHANKVNKTPLNVSALGTLKVDDTQRSYLDSASGITSIGGSTWVVSDGLSTLARYDNILQAGELVQGLPSREKKYDLESITTVPSKDSKSGVALLALGSGSKEDRAIGVLQNVDFTGRADGMPTQVDMSDVYKTIGNNLPYGPNIEGAAARQGKHGVELLLFHRGMLEGDKSSIFTLDANAVIDAAKAGKIVPKEALIKKTTVDLGTLDNGGKLAFSDARALPDGRIVFTASAELSKDGTNGDIAGSAVGVLTPSLKLAELHPLTGPARKVEGIELARAINPDAKANQFTLITDADDPNKASEVLQVELN